MKKQSSLARRWSIAAGVFVAALLVASPRAQDANAPLWNTGTFSILGFDPETGEIGGAVQSRVFSVGNGVLWEAPDGVVWLFYVVRFGETWSTSRVQVKVSHDGALTWSDAPINFCSCSNTKSSPPLIR